jgi:heterodisulfide reductase subunit D
MEMTDTLAAQVNSMAVQELELCYHCHKCTAGCPVSHAMEFGPDRILRLIQTGQMERVLTSRDPWLCAGCDMCSVHCPNQIDGAAIMVALKRLATEMGLRVSDCARLREALAEHLLRLPRATLDERLCAGFGRVDQLDRTIRASHNLSGDDNQTRLIWSANLERIPSGLDRKQSAETIYFVGCVASFFPRSYRVPQAMASILDAAGVEFTTLGGQEWCCGYPLYSMGSEPGAQDLIAHNVSQVETLGAQRIVSSCPSCYHMWKHVYPDVIGRPIGLEVVHATELLDGLVGEGSLPLGSVDLTVTYHDPCDLGRKGGVFEAPRRLLQSIPGLRFVEISARGMESDCCGGGGNLESFDPDVLSEVSHRRIDRACEVLPTGAGAALVSACQQCERTLTAATRHHEEARRVRLRVVDVVEIVWQAVQAA